MDIDKKSNEIKIGNNINENIKTPIKEEKKNKNKIKIKLTFPNSKPFFANKEEFSFLKKKRNSKTKRKNTSNIIINNVVNTLQINTHNKKNKISSGFDTNKIKNKKIEKVEDKTYLGILLEKN